MDTKDTGIKQEPTAPGAEGNDGSFPQSEELEEVMPDNRENQNDPIYFKVTKDDWCLFFHCLQNQNLPSDALTMPVSEMVKRLNPDYTYTFLDLAWGGRRERVYIEVNPNTTEARQFVDLCTGQRGSSFFNTRLTRVRNKGEEGECVFGGNYDSGVNRRLSSDGYCGEERVMFISHTDKSGEFIISTNNNCPKYGTIIGDVWTGLEVLKEAVQLSDITQVTVVDCGVWVLA